jgi:uncharacterized protein YyaL (SSP411 family)
MLGTMPASWVTVPSLVAVACLATGCAGARAAVRTSAPAVTVTAAAAPTAPAPAQRSPDASAKAPLVAWRDLSPEIFAQARRDHRLVILDGAAEWCHWCHVMDSTTYHDPAVVKLLSERFLAAKVDIDERPEIGDRYAAYGWPATVVFDSDGRELGKYRGYIPPEDFLALLQRAVAGTTASGAGEAAPPAKPEVASTPFPREELGWILRSTALELDEYADHEQKSWGHGQKAALYTDNDWVLTRAAAGDRERLPFLLETLEKQRAIVDPVDGGIYQYSTDGDWEHPHFEKLMTFNAGALDNYSKAYQLTHDPKWKAVADAIFGYLDGTLRGTDGGFFATQDADVGAHVAGGAFVDGHVYYAKDAKGRRAIGAPRIDTREYARENGLAIAAYCTYAEATGSTVAREHAVAAAERILATHARAKASGKARLGGLSHETAEAKAGTTAPLLLGDNATFAWALLRLHDLTHEGRWLAEAQAIARAMREELEDRRGGGFFAESVDPRASGVFAVRRTPFEDNVVALRLFVRLQALAPEPDPAVIARTLRAIVTPEQIHARGRMIGDLLLALDEVRASKIPLQ